MTAGSKSDLVIALDYYDGEVEGVARCGGECSYFMRTLEVDDDVNEYEFVAIECLLFDEIAAFLPGVDDLRQLFVYSGSHIGLNQRLDEIVPEFRSQIQQFGRRVRGRNYLQAATSPRFQ